MTPEDLENVRAWKPHLLAPIQDPEALRGSYPLLLDLAAPEGSVNLMGIPGKLPAAALAPRLEGLSRSFREQGVLSSYATVSQTDYRSAVCTGLEALQSAFFRPNLLFARIPAAGEEPDAQVAVLHAALGLKVGVLLYGAHATAGLGRKRDIHLWIRGNPAWSTDAAFESGNLNLMLLMGYRLSRIWRGRLAMVTVIEGPEQEAAARRFLDELADLARLPASVERVVSVGSLEAALLALPVADLSVFGLDRDAPDLVWAAGMVEATRSSCLFVLDSGRESARA